MRQSRNRICEACGAPFVARSGCQRFCSVSCRERCYEPPKREKRTVKQPAIVAHDWDSITRRCKQLGMSYGEAVARGLI